MFKEKPTNFLLSCYSIFFSSLNSLEKKTKQKKVKGIKGKDILKYVICTPMSSCAHISCYPKYLSQEQGPCFYDNNYLATV